MHFITTAVDNKGFLSIDWVLRQRSVRKPGSLRFLDDVHHFHWFDNGEAKQERSYDYPVARRYRTRGVHDKTTRGLYFPMKHFMSDTLPNRVATPDECRYF